MTQRTPDKWYCDSCGGGITDPNMSLMTWRENDDRRGYDYRLVHKNSGDGTCDPGSKRGYGSSLEVSNVLGPDGLSELLSHLSLGPLITSTGESLCRVADMDGYVDIIRRLETPYYEEARRHYGCEAVQQYYVGANETLPYTPKSSQHIATLCVDCEVGH